MTMWKSLAVLLFVVAVTAREASAQAGCSGRGVTIDGQPWFHGTYTNFSVAGREGYIVEPYRPRLPGSPWVWIMGFDPQNTVGYTHHSYSHALLKAGYVIAFFTVGPTHGSPGGVRLMEDFYACVTADFSLNAKARILARSNGGLQAYAYAEAYPTHVDRIGGIHPAVDWRSWPGIANLVRTPTDIGFTAAELANEDTFNPINNLAPLAAHGIKLFHLHGDQDTVVPMLANTTAMAARYRALGGDITIEVLTGLEHAQNPQFDHSLSLTVFLMGLSPIPIQRAAGPMLFSRPGWGAKPAAHVR